VVAAMHFSYVFLYIVYDSLTYASHRLVNREIQKYILNELIKLLENMVT